jgi:hypothetical protein
MGNKTSQLKNYKGTHKELLEMIDAVVTHFIMTSSFHTMQQLQNDKYCNQIIITSADLFEKQFSDSEITFLKRRTDHGRLMNDTATEQFTYFPSAEIGAIDVPQKLKKRRICESIAKFYVKIAHLFSAIMMTLNPVYSYIDEDGNPQQKTQKEKNQIPSAAREKRVSYVGLCFNRVQQLMSKYGNNSGDAESALCGAPTNVSLYDEPGIPELHHLYFDKYDFTSGKFTGMTDERHGIKNPISNAYIEANASGANYFSIPRSSVKR